MKGVTALLDAADELDKALGDVCPVCKVNIIREGTESHHVYGCAWLKFEVATDKFKEENELW